jgi:altronate dehydratase small subunit
MDRAFRCVMMKPLDSVAVALEQIPAGTQLTIECGDYQAQITLAETIEFGHKFAVRSIDQGADILKYGEVIGAAVRDIAPGEHVHVHNLEGKRGRGDRI